MDDKTNIQELKDELIKFSKERDWEQFHTPKDLSIALNIEAGEILEHFRWKSHDEINESLKKEDKKQELALEIADTFFFLLRLASVCDIDLTTALRDKIKINNKRYPAEKVKGKAHKYTYYESEIKQESDENKLKE